MPTPGVRAHAARTADSGRAGRDYEEFVAYTEEFARRNRLPGTLSLRHLLRLASGRKADGTPFGHPDRRRRTSWNASSASRSMSCSHRRGAREPATVELRQRLNAARHVDLAVIDLFREQLDALRRLDRQMGAIVAYGEVREKVEQVQQLHSYSLTPGIRAALAGVLSELGALAGWEALDRYGIGQAWEHHELAKRRPAKQAHTVCWRTRSRNRR